MRPFRFSLRALGLTVTACAVIFGIATWRFGGALIAFFGMFAFFVASRTALGLVKVRAGGRPSRRAWVWLALGALLALFGVAVQANAMQQLADADPILVVGFGILFIGVTSMVLT